MAAKSWRMFFESQNIDVTWTIFMIFVILNGQVQTHNAAGGSLLDQQAVFIFQPFDIPLSSSFMLQDRPRLIPLLINVCICNGI